MPPPSSPRHDDATSNQTAAWLETRLDQAAAANPNARLTTVQMHRAHTDGAPSLGVGSTAFMRAAKAGDTPVMKLLLAHGADPNLVQKNGNDALMLAAGLGYRDGNMAVPTRDSRDHRGDPRRRASRRDRSEAMKFVSGLPAR